MLMQSSSASWPPGPFRYLERRQPLCFPESAEVPEHPLHLELRTALYLLLKETLRHQCSVRSDQSVYWNASDPSQCLAPDAFVRLVPDVPLTPTWKVWELGAPDVAVEIISQSDAGASAWRRKLEAYGALGVREVLRFAPEESRVLRIWDRVDGALLERELEGEFIPSSVLRLYWTVAPIAELGPALRVATRPSWGHLVPTLEEARVAEAQGRAAEARARAAEAQGRAAEAQARKAAEQRAEELEQELKRLKGETP